MGGVSQIGLLGAALAAGLLAAPHCAGMCGGIVGAQQLAGKPVHLSKNRAAFVRGAVLRALPFNFGRISTYAVLGAMAGGAGRGIALVETGAHAGQYLFIGANIALIAMGVAMAARLNPAAGLERLGGTVWARVRPAAAKLVSSASPAHGALLGLLWGLMPCALVYTFLLSALASGDALNGALLMLAFGMGTIPNLLAVSIAWAWPGHGGPGAVRPARARLLKQLVAAIVVIFGVAGLLHTSAGARLLPALAYCRSLLA